MKNLFLFVLVYSFSARAAAPVAFPALVERVKDRQAPRTVKLTGGKLTYEVKAHSPEIASRLKGRYTAEELKALAAFLDPLTQIKVDARGIVQAADRALDAGSAGDPTHYDAVWVRDSLWAYLALSDRPETLDDGIEVLRALFAYFSSPDQLKRMRDAIRDPKRLLTPDGAMRAIHIRFDGRSREFHDVQVNGKPQTWNHKQNDALGLFLDLALRALLSGRLPPATLKPEAIAVLVYLPAYFRAIGYADWEDAGSWEEIEKINTSSVALVISALERLRLALADKTLGPPLMRAARAAKLSAVLQPKTIDALISRGYARVRRQLVAGGEAPLYPKDSPKRRMADAALLNLLYPAQLAGLGKAERQRVREIVAPLIGEVGIKRYLVDSYQAGNYWYPSTAAAQGAQKDEKTADSSSASAFLSRAKGFSADSEAQWFFDSWYAKALSVDAREESDPALQDEAWRHFNRALGQLTGGTVSSPWLGADGLAVPPLAAPESYNSILANGTRYFVPSPITPLNWAKGCLRLALDELRAASQ